MAEEGVEFQLYADPGLLPRAARFTTGYVRLVGQEPAPSNCVQMSTRDLGGECLDTTFRGWSATLAAGGQVVHCSFLLSRWTFMGG